MESSISRRGFGQTLGAGMISGLVAPSVSNAADEPRPGAKRMTTRLRELINRPGIVAAPGIYDPVSARIAEALGFEALDLPGSALGYASGVMEPNLCLEDMAEATRRITSVVNIPVVVDVGAGFGEPAHMMRTVRLMENAGASRIHIEDHFHTIRTPYNRCYQIR